MASITTGKINSIAADKKAATARRSRSFRQFLHGLFGRRIVILGAVGVAFFILKAFSFPSRLHTVLCCILYTLVFILFTLTVSGRIPTRVPLILVFVLPFLYHIFVEDMALLTSAAPPTFLAWMPEISVLLIMAGLAAFAAGLRKKE